VDIVVKSASKDSKKVYRVKWYWVLGAGSKWVEVSLEKRKISGRLFSPGYNE